MSDVRRATEEDAEAVFVLAAEMAVSFTVEREAFGRGLSSVLNTAGAHLLVVGAVEGYLLGFVHPTFYANGPVGWVEEIAVRHDRRRHGLGARLMAAFEDLARSEGCVLTALATRRAADFYAALGYQAGAEYFSKRL
ncbi:GNAT family N-acetyltransferase [Cryptosporangium aurantiacum]|uniref:Ribosomal protein S18 acetylase RimI n=1 Tax=Cryptosporangium aurantiacum TaxID=134849 RepID=A0A1M7RDM3_9ACTN|nr:GNAT family N-acetyltransferase [Cryptosporangium aurantiacum]SHN44316.1 Ribosomal protein S18 acetylase RimI [Cryptosporangium aurantiacum]